MGAGAREGARLLSDRQGRIRLDRDAVLCLSAPFSANVAGLSHRLESRTREQQTHARDFLFLEHRAVDAGPASQRGAVAAGAGRAESPPRPADAPARVGRGALQSPSHGGLLCKTVRRRLIL